MQLLTVCVGYDHTQGPGKIEPLSCEVEFHILIPENLNISPYILLISHGIHTHPPPPPNKPPQAIISTVLDIIQSMRNPDFALRKSL